MTRTVFAQLLTRNLNGEVVEMLGSFGTLRLDGRNRAEVWHEDASTLAAREAKLGKEIVGYRILRGSLLNPVVVSERLF